MLADASAGSDSDVVSDDGSSIAPDAQAGVVKAMKDDATVRFADTRDETLELEAEDAPVKDHAVLVLVGPVPDEGSPIDLAVEVYRNSEDHQDYTLQLDGDGADWVVTSWTAS